MSKFGFYGKIVAQPGQRDTLTAILLEAAASMHTVEGCDLYIVNVSPTEPDAIWVTEIWNSQEAHATSLTLESSREAIQRARPLIAGGERIELIPLGGKGIS